MKYFIVADVHSFYNEMKTALDNAGFEYDNPDHIFVSLGDLLDRGPDAVKCLQFVNGLPNERKILIRGNHDDLLEECLIKWHCAMHDYHNGTADTIEQIATYQGYTEDCADTREKFYLVMDSKLYNDYTNCLVDYAVVDKNLFVHAWAPWEQTDERVKYVLEDPENRWFQSRWQRARWENPFDMWYTYGYDKDYTIFVGHWHCSWAHSRLHKDGTEFAATANFEPFIDEGIVGLDACTAYSGKVNCYVLEV